MEDVDISDWLNAIQARKIDRRVSYCNDTLMANSATSKKGYDNYQNYIRGHARERKINLNHHKVIDQSRIEKTRKRLIGGKRINNDSKT